ncbi:MAG TPA: hypothetical protein VH437_02765 [Terriglobales bacterium]|jgi:hypothetical protein
MKSRGSAVVFFLLILLVALPARAYVDPSGGMLFQVLMPMLAAIWGAWMIFAQRIRKRVGNLFRKRREMEPQDPAA